MSEIKTDQDLQQKEWQTARDVISKFDDRLDGLRRYGFTFITGLLTAQSLLASSLILGTPNTATSTIQPSVKLAVTLVTLILIVALRLLDRNYQLFQKAAEKRAEIIEESLNLELSETISDVYHHDRMWLSVPIIYWLFAVAAGLLGSFLIAGINWARDLIIVATLATLIGIVLIQGLLKLEDSLDYTFDKLKVTKGDSLIITVTNLGKERLIPKASLKWYMEPQDGQPLPYQENPEELDLRTREQYYLKWDTTPATITAGFYHFAVRDNPQSRTKDTRERFSDWIVERRARTQGGDTFPANTKQNAKTATPEPASRGKFRKKSPLKGGVVPRKIQVLPPSPPTPVSPPTPPTRRA